ncbi:DUF2188 domain-containing protein [Calidithermus timidus]|uniref:DUF2188 domain-containing protein n=1 Tax=Calidithermus timidus TaxID=307124 RepID=UPI000A02E4DA
MGKSKRLHVVPHQGDWAVKREGSKRASTVTRTKAEAEQWAKEKACEEGGEVVIHDKQGRISDSDSYGNDPHPPNDKKH